MMVDFAKSPQLPLGIALREVASFKNFIAGQNGEAVAWLRRAIGGADERIFFLWGESGAGKSHLLQAVCREITALSEPAAYLPLAQLPEVSPTMLNGMDALGAVCVDDVETVAGNAAWEEALFHLFNRIRDNNKMLVVAGRSAPAQLPLRLADLRSRLGWGAVCQIKALDDDGKMQAMQQRARGRGLELPDDVAAFLLRHYRRDTGNLFALLDRLDETSLIAQRRLTIPFVKTIIDQ
ncbi:MAG: regulatory inactivation of DnaA Hda protein [Gammaproteobacteria bacterium]|nr:MAG: regulatory inactivation of DnaA Hda protein [Gammaproteobacteria bacterium]